MCDSRGDSGTRAPPFVHAMQCDQLLYSSPLPVPLT
jgi:hypothetical protein